mgnify:FL=1
MPSNLPYAYLQTLGGWCEAWQLGFEFELILLFSAPGCCFAFIIPPVFLSLDSFAFSMPPGIWRIFVNVIDLQFWPVKITDKITVP